MDEQAMLTRDLVLRLCANATEFDEAWIDDDAKVVVPFTASRDTALIRAIVSAGEALGVERLLVCRTRAEYAYEPVTEVPVDAEALIALVRGWGAEPTDFLVAIEDISAGVLVTTTELTVAAGPDVFVRELVGPDLAAARIAFGEEARTSRDPELLRAAQRYACLEQGARHARGTRGPGPDLAERIEQRLDSLRRGSPRATTALRALRGAWGWAMLVVLLLAGVFVPGVPAALPVVLAMVWLLAQLAWLARSRTVAFSTLVRTLAFGAFLAWPMALAELALAGALGLAADDPYAYAYVAVPVEEVGKLLPLLLCLFVARRRFRRFAAVDLLLLAAASGAGFHVAEQAVRAMLVAGGSVDPFAAHLGMFALLPGWVEVPVAAVSTQPFQEVALLRFSGHAVTSGLVGAALGLALVGARRYGVWLWALPPLALGAAALEHLNFNAVVAGLDPTPLTTAVFALYGDGAATRWLLLLLLVLAVLLDYRVARSATAEVPRLPGRPPLAALVRAAHGRAVRVRVRVPGDIAPTFRHFGLLWARIPVALVETLATILHEYAVMVVAASRGPATLCRSWIFLRRRREYAMGAARAAGRPWRRSPSREELAETEVQLATRLGVGPRSASIAAVAVLAVSTALAHPALSGSVPHADGAYALMSLRALSDWVAALPAGTRPWVWAGGVALASLLVSGWSVPREHPSVRHFLRDPRGNLGGLLGALAPGQVPYGVAGLVGFALPARTDRLLRPRG
ncbi:PrsW family glutamic-type intramembrane protease [Marinactinospora thermotolerans]|nr:PrsW family glutamic-type intramembrane protease [Marinactinospora thermotolerans]